MSDINMTPLIDVMLVLLVIFMITAPLMTSALKLDLPKAEARQPSDAPQSISLSRSMRRGSCSSATRRSTSRRCASAWRRPRA
jgi:biopolymer transport protein ExbD